MTTSVLQVSGMSCGHCIKAVTTALAALPTVTVGSVTIGRAEVSHDAATTDSSALIRAVEKAGYTATLSHDASTP